MKRFVDEFHEALAGELEALVDLDVYCDVLRLQGGDFYDQGLARSLCESACMVMIFTPTYFSAAHPYCAREYVAMKEIEAVRLPPGAEHGLIIPVVVRGFDELPAEISSRRQAYRFESFTMSDQRLSKNKKYSAEVGKLAHYIASRCRALRSLEVDCDGFAMPSDAAVMELASQFSPNPPPFPGRKAPCE
jgi:hypothetical protein